MEKEKLVVIDLWGSLHHQNINQKYIDFIERFREIKLIEINNLLNISNLKSEKISILIDDKEGNKIKNRLRYLVNILKINKYIKKTETEIFILCYDIITFLLFYILNYKKRIILFQHQHINEVQKVIHKLFFKLYMDKVEHIVLEEEFKKNFVKNLNIPEKKVYVCHHPLFLKEIDYTKSYHRKNIISISNSYNQKLMDEFLIKVKELKNINCLIRNRKINFYEKNIISENRKYTQNELKQIYEKANIVIIMVETKSFNNRISGTIFDGLSNGCFILSNDIDIANILKEKYPNIIEIYTSIDDLITKIKNINLEDKKENFLKDLKKFREDYSDEKITTELRRVFGDKNEK